MAELKVSKQKIIKKEGPTPQAKKVKDLRASGKSLREIAEELHMSRGKVEKLLSIPA